MNAATGWECRRYTEAGKRCEELTATPDWCRRCAGFLKPGSQPRWHPSQYWFPHALPVRELLGQVHTDQVPVAASVVVQWEQVHGMPEHTGGAWASTNARVRDLLGDLLLFGRASQSETGMIALASRGRATGYSFLLSGDGGAALGYRTCRRETNQDVRALWWAGLTVNGWPAKRIKAHAWQLAKAAVFGLATAAHIQAALEGRDPRLAAWYGRCVHRLLSRHPLPDDDPITLPGDMLGPVDLRRGAAGTGTRTRVSRTTSAQPRRRATRQVGTRDEPRAHEDSGGVIDPRLKQRPARHDGPYGLGPPEDVLPS
ncbi:hypothetical protein ACQEVF_57715 [Nonomuraea polychroma]|uniref:hypothetical protein n=1 Tax=Nonomuraea polychroma TaxID=46176 RepID=UPI003D8D44D2